MGSDAGAPGRGMGNDRLFPRGFLLGAATAAHQVEGDNRRSDWWAYEEEGRLPHRSGEACRHWELFESDFDLARDWGHNAHRFSVEWSRVEPEPGRWSEEALDHYRDVVRALRERCIEPIVTLHHFTNPAWLARDGGWLRRDAPALFARYAGRVAAALGQEVRWWLTLNEPTVYAKHGYVAGDWPPCRRNAWIAAGRVLLQMARAHRAAFRALRAQCPGARVGFAHSAPWIEPCDPRRPADRAAAAIREFLLNRAFFLLIGAARRPRRRPMPMDFIGINYYARSIVRGGGQGLSLLFGEECRREHHTDRGPFTDTGWEVHPAGLLGTLRRFATYGVPILITENGVATRDEALRLRFLREHLHAVARALREGLPVAGYLYWTLMDNYEWALGTTARFGLAAVEPGTGRRLPRPAARAFAHVCRTGRLPDSGLREP